MARHAQLTWVMVAVLVLLSACGGSARRDRPYKKPYSTQRVTRAPAQPGAETYRVVAGDTLYSIAFRNSLDYHDIARWNGIGADYLISPGQLLRLRAPGGSPGYQPVIASTPDSAPVAVEPPPVIRPSAPEIKTAPPPVALQYPVNYEWQWPTRGGILREYAPDEGAKGLDIGGKLGQPVFAAAPGRVVYSGNALKGYGELIIIKHDDTYLSAYGYNRKRYVVEGDVVTTGQPIGELGLGPENKPLLHFEIRSRGKPVNPAGYLPKNG